MILFMSFVMVDLLATLRQMLLKVRKVRQPNRNVGESKKGGGHYNQNDLMS